ncbi:branched-chain amino acid ABC transporter permease [Acidisoma cellulosilytica]|uniref:Branched-chain amino acid ABC transporter permease n=1 Tax=Acidisoma cellulosilyticum TaxID=2802395 RepID=A0A964E605_9PROT|nr:branched-chain amino acid ABC transporter permease [Acidisoma cellulosilyticum]MCB8883094.1 branched-chain amino acid ABC transporter permease [Acidisoma cellulosilyticum]
MLLLQLLINGLVTGSALGIIAISFSLAYSTTRIFHVAHAGIYTLAGYVAYALEKSGAPDIVGLLAAMAICAVAGALIQSELYARLAQRRASHLAVLIASLGLLAVIQNFLASVFTPNILPFGSAWRGRTLSFGGVTLTEVQIATLVICLAVFPCSLWFTRRTVLGKQIRAVASNPFLAEITALRPQRTFVIVMAIASAMVAIPGALVAFDFGVQPYDGTTVLLTATIAVIAGGIGSLTGAFLMAMLISVLQNLSLLVISGEWSVGVTFLIFLVFMLFRPRGLFTRR